MLSGAVFAGETGHYVNGVEGLKGGTVPPTGLYYRIYNVFYNADTLTDSSGNEVPVDFDVSIYAMVNRVIWVTDKKLLGADVFMDVVVPLVYTDLEIGALNVADDKFGLGDINIEPFGLSWHAPWYDAAFGLSVYLPTGDYDKNQPASPGKDMWTGMVTLGTTVYLDQEKTWSAAVLGRYEIHSEKSDTDITPGNDFHFEWGLGKTLAKVWDVGLTGYCQWQVSDDSGAGSTSVKDRVYAAGPEISLFYPPVRLFVSLRSQWEFGAKDRSEGNVTVLTFTKSF
jgi:hypothetical protein